VTRRSDDDKRATPPVELVEKRGERKDVMENPGEPPVVARLVIEIRSDGSRTIARGAMEDVVRGERVAVKAEGTTPLSLALSLARTIFSLPAIGKSILGKRGLLPGRKK
jgi:hypothetical protein